VTKDKTISRRGFIKSTAVGVGALAAPALISSKALASSGELNFTGWAGYPDLKAKVFPAFEKATGIKVNFTELPDQDAMFAQAKVALQSGGIDMIEPLGRLEFQRPAAGVRSGEACDGQLSARSGRWRRRHPQP
jgi:spermidine/putrescine transport system substrate-binding protein